VLIEPAPAAAVAEQDPPERSRALPARTPRWVAAGLAAAVLAPFALLAGRVAVTGRQVFLNGDLALIDVQAHRAAAWQLALGPYDRYGWHHPGPVFLYLVAAAQRVVGTSHGAQAEVCTAVMVNGLALASVVYVLARRLGTRPGLAALSASLVVAAGLGPAFLTSAWNPCVVLLPLFLCGVLAALSMLGSATAWCAALLVGTFAVQTDVGTVPFVVLVVGTAGVVVGWRLRRGRAVDTSPAAMAVLLAATAVCWAPVLSQQWRGPRGNLAAIARFLEDGGAHAGPVTGLSATGYGLAGPLHLLVPAAPSNPSLLAWLRTQIVVQRWPGIVASVLAVAALSGLLWATRRRRDGSAAVTWAASAGFVAAVCAGAAVIGPAFRWLLAWAGAVTALVLLAGALVVAGARLLDRRGAARALGVLVAAGALAATVAGATVGDGLGSDPAVAQAWARLSPVVARHPHPVVGLLLDTTGMALAGGVEDQLAVAGVPFEVPARWENQYTSDSSARPTVRIALGAQTPPGYVRLATVRGVAVSYAEGSGPMSSSTWTTSEKRL